MLPSANRSATANQSVGNCQPVSTVSAALEVETSAVTRDLDLQLLLKFTKIEESGMSKAVACKLPTICLSKSWRDYVDLQTKQEIIIANQKRSIFQPDGENVIHG